MTDHYADAKLLLADAFEETAPEWFTARAITAQVHATLALAEQQRIANLIALANTEEPWAFESYRALVDEEDVLRPEIARALRIETP